MQLDCVKVVLPPFCLTIYVRSILVMWSYISVSSIVTAKPTTNQPTNQKAMFCFHMLLPCQPLINIAVTERFSTMGNKTKCGLPANIHKMIPLVMHWIPGFSSAKKHTTQESGGGVWTKKILDLCSDAQSCVQRTALKSDRGHNATSVSEFHCRHKMVWHQETKETKVFALRKMKPGAPRENLGVHLPWYNFCNPSAIHSRVLHQSDQSRVEHMYDLLLLIRAILVW